MSDIVRKRFDHDEDEQSKASVYSSYAAHEDQQVRREGGRVRYMASDYISLKGCIKDFNILNEIYSIPTGGRPRVLGTLVNNH